MFTEQCQQMLHGGGRGPKIYKTNCHQVLLELPNRINFK